MTLPDDAFEVIFVPWVTHWRTKKRIYPKTGRVFAIRVRKKKQ